MGEVEEQYQNNGTRYLRIVEKLIQARAKAYLRNRHFWIISVIVAAEIVLYYIEYTPLVAYPTFKYSLFTGVHDFQRTLFFIPAIYAAIVFRIRGATAVSLIFLAVVLPRAVVFSPYPDPLTRSILFCVVTFYVSALVALQLNYSEYQIKAAGDLDQLKSEVVKLGEERASFVHFLGMAVHDMKAPLAAVQGYFQVMLGGLSGELNSKQKHMLERSSKRVSELTELISDILDIPRIESGRVVEGMEWFSLGDEIRGCIEDLRNLAKESAVELRVEVPEKLGKVYGAPPYIRRAIMNLVNNAVRYAPDGVVEIKAREDGDNILVEVTDNGVGIPQDELPRIFEEFFRGSNTNVKGTGLGLTITKRIVKAHGGRIWVESPVPGNEKGARFTFTLSKKPKSERTSESN